jgi:hypothetical protein
LTKGLNTESGEDSASHGRCGEEDGDGSDGVVAFPDDVLTHLVELGSRKGVFSVQTDDDGLSLLLSVLLDEPSGTANDGHVTGSKRQKSISFKAYEREAKRIGRQSQGGTHE